MSYNFQIEELEVWQQYLAEYFLEVLNGDKSLEEAQEDLASFRGGKWYTGSNPMYKLPEAADTQSSEEVSGEGLAAPQASQEESDSK